MLIKKPGDIKPSEITDEAVYFDRRRFLAASLSLAAAGALAGARLEGVRKSAFSTTETPTPFKDIASYNNFYEFGTDKQSPAKLAKSLVTRPWTVAVEGLVRRPKIYAIDELLRLAPLEERIYRLRCVEGWSMVIPWVGFSLSEVLRRAEPESGARYVEFVSLYDPKQMPGQRDRVLDWPYAEGLRLDEAQHPLAILAFGLYGEVLPNQNGAPVRLVVPWKYGFKSAKSIVRIRLTDKQPLTAWMKAAPREYGFYSNVNPAVAHARWSQAKERRIGEFAKRDTLPFNGYADQVAQLYASMDLRTYF